MARKHKEETPSSLVSASGAIHTGGNYDAEHAELIRAMQEYQRVNGRRFPSYTEVMEVMRSLGWRKVAERGPLPRFGGNQ